MKNITAKPKEISPGIIADLGLPLGINTAHVSVPKEKNTGEKYRIWFM